MKCNFLLASTKSTDLEDALATEMEKTQLMEENMKKLDEAKKKGDEVLAQESLPTPNDPR